MGDTNQQFTDVGSLAEIYCAIQQGHPTTDELRSLLNARHWFYELATFDQRTGQAMPLPLGRVCDRVGVLLRTMASAAPKDRLYRILEHTRAPITEIVRSLNEILVREHAVMPVHAVRELDSSSFAALCRRPGRTVKEKLSGRPYLQAVRRRASADTAANRLFKAFCVRLQELLRLRTECLSEPDDGQTAETLRRIEAWLRASEVDEIGRWENLPPNNTLLEHRNYRRVWDAWLWLQQIDEDLRQDYQRIFHRFCPEFR